MDVENRDPATTLSGHKRPREEPEPRFVEAATYGGSKPGYYFGAAAGRLGYHADFVAAAARVLVLARDDVDDNATLRPAGADGFGDAVETPTAALEEFLRLEKEIDESGESKDKKSRDKKLTNKINMMAKLLRGLPIGNPVGDVKAKKDKTAKRRAKLVDDVLLLPSVSAADVAKVAGGNRRGVPQSSAVDVAYYRADGDGELWETVPEGPERPLAWRRFGSLSVAADEFGVSHPQLSHMLDGQYVPVVSERIAVRPAVAGETQNVELVVSAQRPSAKATEAALLAREAKARVDDDAKRLADSALQDEENVRVERELAKAMGIEIVVHEHKFLPFAGLKQAYADRC